MNYRHIAVEGNIGAGKTALAQMLAAHYQAKLVLEAYADNNFLPKFYENPTAYAFPLELSFLAGRFTQLKALPAQELFHDKIVTDYTFAKSKLFARINLGDDEYSLFRQLFDIMEPSLPTPDLLIYLHAPLHQLQRNIRHRGRAYEQQIADDYLEQIQQVYQQYLKQESCKTIIIDMVNTDFLNQPDHFRQLTDFLDKDYEFRQHYLAIN
jgi:deoxyguanosine kinase